MSKKVYPASDDEGTHERAALAAVPHHAHEVLTDVPRQAEAIVRRVLFATPVSERSSLVRLLSLPADNCVLMPKAYFKASNELVVLTLIVCWILTLAVDYKLAVDHPARRFVGHMNPCFGWDYAPASYIAVFSCAADVYLAWTYATLEAMRTKLRDYDGKTSRAERFSLVTTYLHGLASMVWMLLWIVGPPDGQWAAHLAIFSIAVGFRYLCTLGNYVESRWGQAWTEGRVHRKHTIFIVTYGVVTALLPVLYFTDVFVYQAQGRTGVDPPIQWWLLQILDVAWMTCLALSTRLSIPEPPILVTRRVIEFDQELNPEDFSTAQLRTLRKLGFAER